MAEGKLTALKVKNLHSFGHHGDGGGLYLRISVGRRSWMFRYKIAGQQHWMGLGPEGDFTLSEAREKARECRRQLNAGIDPLAARNASREASTAARAAELAKKVSFDQAVGIYLGEKQAEWKNAKHAAQWQATLSAYASPVFGKKVVGAVTVEDVLAALKPIWREKRETASRLRGRIEKVLDFAKVQGWRSGENPARWRGHLDHPLSKRAADDPVKHHAAVPVNELPGVMASLAQSGGTSALCLRFAILTAARSGEARGARWKEFDMDAGVWTVPPERMKAGREHRVPLSAAAVAILRGQEPLRGAPAGLVFPGGRTGRPLSDVAVAKALRAVAPGATVHGMRSTFRDWVADASAFPGEIAEAALAHSNRDRVEAAYLRSDHLERRRRLMDTWAEFCTASARTSELVRLRKARG